MGRGRVGEVHGDTFRRRDPEGRHGILKTLPQQGASEHSGTCRDHGKVKVCVTLLLILLKAFLNTVVFLQ